MAAGEQPLFTEKLNANLPLCAISGRTRVLVVRKRQKADPGSLRRLDRRGAYHYIWPARPEILAADGHSSSHIAASRARFLGNPILSLFSLYSLTGADLRLALVGGLPVRLNRRDNDNFPIAVSILYFPGSLQTP